MDTDPSSPHDMPTQQQVAHMRASGKLTAEEALAMESDDSEEREATMRGVRVRHARARLDAAVAMEAISEDDAAELLQQVKQGKHSRALRSSINKLTRSRPAKAKPDDA